MNVNRACVVAIMLALSGCAGGERPEPVIRIQKVEVPVPVPCVDKIPARPQSPVDGLTPDAPLGDIVKAILAERALMQAYLKRLEATLQACTAAGPPW